MKIKIKDSKTLKDSIDILKKKIMDAEIDLTQKGVESIANALLAKKEDINNAGCFEDLRETVVPVVKKFDTPKGREILMKIDEFDRLYKRDPRKGSHNDFWLWEKLLKYVWNIILKASGNPSPDVKEVKEEDSCMKDEDERMDKVAKLLGEAHDKIMEALDIVEELENEEIVTSDFRYELEDLEASSSDFDYMGENHPSVKLMERFGVDKQEDEEDEESEEDVDEYDPDDDFDI